MRRMKHLCIISTFLLLFSACHSEEPVSVIPPLKNTEVELSVYIPGLRLPMRAADEDALSDLTVVGFTVAAGGTEEIKFIQTVASTDVFPNGTGNADIRLHMPPGDYNRFALLANSGTVLTDHNLTIGSSYTQWQTSGLSKNIMGTSGEAESVPMYGELRAPTQNGMKVTAGVPKTFSDRINLIRAVARIDVKNQATSDGFVLQKVHLCNSWKNGNIYITPTSYTGGSYSSPSLPTALTANVTPVSYTVNTTGVLEKTIYACEQAAGSVTSHQFSGPRLVFEGTYNGRPCFYPADFTSDGTQPSGGGAAGNFVPILRNHKYIFVISSVKSEGYGTLQDALQTEEHLTNRQAMTINTVTINEAYTDIAFNDMAYLAVTRTDITLKGVHSTSSTENKFEVYTDWASGFTVTAYNADGTPVTTANQWLQSSQTTGSGSTKVTLSAITNGTGVREGYLLVRAGRLTTKVNIHQTWKLPLEYVAEYNLAGGSAYGTRPNAGATTAQTDTQLRWATNHNNDQSGYYNWYVCKGELDPTYNSNSLNLFSEVFLRDYHLPSQEEWVGIFGFGTLSPINGTNAVYAGGVAHSHSGSEKIEFAGIKRTFDADVKTAGTGIGYAVRFKQGTGVATVDFPLAPDNAMRCAYRYERIGSMIIDNNTNHVKVSSVFLGSESTDDINTISNEAWWNAQPSDKVIVRIFPIPGHFDSASPGNALLLKNRGLFGYYWQSKEWTSPTGAYYMLLNETGLETERSTNKYFGACVRPFSNR